MFCSSDGENRVLRPSFEIEHEGNGRDELCVLKWVKSVFALNSTQFEFGGALGKHSICVEATHVCKGLDGSVG
jgi:hypothetical protein